MRPTYLFIFFGFRCMIHKIFACLCANASSIELIFTAIGQITRGLNLFGFVQTMTKDHRMFLTPISFTITIWPEFDAGIVPCFKKHWAMMKQYSIPADGWLTSIYIYLIHAYEPMFLCQSTAGPTMSLLFVG